MNYQKEVNIKDYKIFFKSLKILDYKNTILINSRSNDRFFKKKQKKISQKYKFL